MLVSSVLNRPAVLIVGASRGIGFELTQQYIDEGWDVHATTRSGARPDQLRVDANPPIMYKLDVRKQSEIDALVESLAHAPIDVLIVCAGVADRPSGPAQTGATVPEKDIFATNTDAPILIAEAVFPNLQASGNGRMIFLSSLGGSRAAGPLSTAYQRSKAELNDQIRRYAQEWRLNGVVGLAMHPGWVATDMGGAQGRVQATDSAKGIREIANGMQVEHNGGFFDYQGAELPW